MAYQTFPRCKGDSASLEKLIALRLPALKDKSFLDIGCNEGFFCGYAAFDGASRVVGIDRSKGAIESAKLTFPDCDFHHQSWDTLPEGSFDVILLASALHYAEDQEALIHRLMDKLTADGILILELGMNDSSEDKWVKVRRSIDERDFPTLGKIKSILGKYAWKMIGPSVTQPGDPVQRFVLHISHLKPYVFLMLDPPASGKTTLCRLVFDKSDICTLSGDRILCKISNKQMAGCSSALQKLVTEEFSTLTIGYVTEKIFVQGLGGDLIDVWCANAGGSNFAVDSYLHKRHHETVKSLLTERGYIPVFITCPMDIRLPNKLTAQKLAGGYFAQLESHQQKRGVEYIDIIKTKKEDLYNQGLYKWNLDHPCRLQPLYRDMPLNFVGWVLAKNGILPCSQGYIESNGQKRYFDINQTRIDVINATAQSGDLAEGQTAQCGFSFTLDQIPPAASINFGFVIGQQEICAAKIRRTQHKKSPSKFSEQPLSALKALLKTKFLSR